MYEWDDVSSPVSLNGGFKGRLTPPRSTTTELAEGDGKSGGSVTPLFSNKFCHFCHPHLDVTFLSSILFFSVLYANFVFCDYPSAGATQLC